MPDNTRPPGPGLAKTRGAPLFRRRILHLVATSDGPLRDLFDRADIVSEGESRQEGDALIYYGSTSLLLAPCAARAQAPGVPLLLLELARAVALDPHVRLRALRIAHREAAARAGAPLGTLHAELTFPAPPAHANRSTHIVALTVDVAAIVLRNARLRGAPDR